MGGVSDKVVEILSENPELFEHTIAHVTIKHIVRNNDNSDLAKGLVSTYEGKLLEVLGSSNRGAFILTALLDTESVSKQVSEELSKNMKVLKEKAKKLEISKGFEVLIKKLEVKANLSDEEEDSDEIAPLPSKILGKPPKTPGIKRLKRTSVDGDDDDTSVSSLGSIYSDGGSRRRSSRVTPRKTYKE